MVTRTAAGGAAADAEPVTVELAAEGGLALTLDDGEELLLDLDELLAAIEAERAPAEEAEVA